MTSVQNIRPATEPTALRDLLGAHLTAGQEQQVSLDLDITGISVNTGDLEPGWAFVGIPGMTRHGAELADRAKAAGARVLVTDQTGADLAENVDIPVAIVSDPRTAAAVLAQGLHGVAVKGLTTVAVTGTNGKTTSTYLVRQVLQPLLGQSALLGTLEVDTGRNRMTAERTTAEAPVLYRALAEAQQQGLHGAVVEVSSHALSLGRVDGIDFDLALFTNLQHDHLDFYENSKDLYFDAKAMLFTPGHAKQGVVAVDDKWTRKLARSPQVPVTAVQVLTEDDPDIGQTPLWRVRDIEADAARGGTKFKLIDPSGASTEAFCPIPGSVNVQNAAIAVVGAHQLGLPLDQAVAALAATAPIPGRMQWIPTDRDVLPAVMVDYAHTPEAILALIETLRPLTQGQLHVVFGTDGDRDATKREPLAEVVAELADVLWVTDENPRFEDAASIRKQLLRGIRKVRPGLEQVHEVTTCRRDALREAIAEANPQDLVVIIGKGAELAQEVQGVYHSYYEPDVAAEIVRGLTGLPRRRGTHD